MNTSTVATPATGLDPRVENLVRGAIDLHCHSGPSVMARYLDHLEAMREASEAGLKAVLLKDHYYSATPVTYLLNKHFSNLGVLMLSGVPLNNAVGGLNVHAVEHGIKLGARLVWMPTFSSANHIDHHKQDHKFTEKFPQTKKKMIDPVPLTVLDANGKLKEEVKDILDLIAEADVVLSAGHLHISEIWPLFDEARKRGVKRLLVNHPTYVVDATLDDMKVLARDGVYMEHSMCMWVPGSKFKFYEPEFLRQIIEAGTVDRTILGSDLGQQGNPRIVDGFRHVIRTCLDLGYGEAEVRKMTSTNASALMGI
ncbi:DUF6282 family protein [Pigmentiphaga sp.]|uniref:DUF6282 family protein n=1 Tax=Pigmentiphaga sp. TaxID=1977564 RepID=UPI00128D71A6|nr:DUF6282 family protein [Pigmentiphaga sp.]MPS27210.1 hypothetical protein [Alcaligenaceae bacterium SAGV5]MPS51646.1 hypothetical protein [Alcaligenaceae bacterium SAGV3]MPT55488.1 hypothetical protein [Alcaligenaceae bacterium]